SALQGTLTILDNDSGSPPAATVLTGDFNGDKAPDFVRVDPQQGTLQIALRNGTTVAEQPLVAVAMLQDWKDLRVADVNGDGRDDVIGRLGSLSGVPGDWSVARSTGSSFVVENWHGNWNSHTDWKDVQVGDFNGDYRQDLAGRDPATGDWQVALSTGTQFISQ